MDKAAIDVAKALVRVVIRGELASHQLRRHRHHRGHRARRPAQLLERRSLARLSQTRNETCNVAPPSRFRLLRFERSHIDREAVPHIGLEQSLVGLVDLLANEPKPSDLSLRNQALTFALHEARTQGWID
jgi:hypothetical protein